MHQARDENGSDSRSLDDIREFEPVELDVEPSDRPPRADGVVVWTAEEARSRSTRADNDANARGHEKVDILFLAANPRGADMLALEKEAGDIFRKTERVRRLERKLSMSTRIDDLAHDLLRHRPTVVHFAGHGSRGGKLLLEDEHGAAALVSVAALGRLFRDVGGVRCVVLNACFSAEHASAVAQHVPCVVAMSAAIADTAAIAFASAASVPQIRVVFAIAAAVLHLRVNGPADAHRAAELLATVRDEAIAGIDVPAMGSWAQGAAALAAHAGEPAVARELWALGERCAAQTWQLFVHGADPVLEAALGPAEDRTQIWRERPVSEVTGRIRELSDEVLQTFRR